MPDTPTLLAIDQGTTSSRAIVFDTSGQPLAKAQQEFRQIYPRDGWVEHDPEDIWGSALTVCRRALNECGEQVAAIGITNQRETVVVWDRASGKAVHNAIVWQDRRTAQRCAELREAGKEDLVRSRTGLLLDPYFSGTKLAWLLDNVSGLRQRAERGELAFGTVDSFLLWHLTQGAVHATDATNASRTLLFNIHTQDWDDDLLALFDIPRAMLPEVRDCASDFGMASKELLGQSIPIAGIAGDQQAALIGQACFETGMIKSTYGTGCFAVLNTGDKPLTSQNRLLTTVGYRLDGRVSYAVEGSIFIAGAVVQWLRDGLGLIESSEESEELAKRLEDNHGVYMVPALTGLGAPHWDPHARGALFGMTRDTRPEHLARAALESVCYQTHDLINAMANDGAHIANLRVDGGMVINDWLLQFMADVLDMPVERPRVIETTALGSALLAGLQTGVIGSLDELARCWQREKLFEPRKDAGERRRLLERWTRAVECARGFSRN